MHEDVMASNLCHKTCSDYKRGENYGEVLLWKIHNLEKLRVIQKDFLIKMTTC